MIDWCGQATKVFDAVMGLVPSSQNATLRKGTLQQQCAQGVAQARFLQRLEGVRNLLLYNGSQHITKLWSYMGIVVDARTGPHSNGHALRPWSLYFSTRNISSTPPTFWSRTSWSFPSSSSLSIAPPRTLTAKRPAKADGVEATCWMDPLAD